MPQGLIRGLAAWFALFPNVFNNYFILCYIDLFQDSLQRLVFYVYNDIKYIWISLQLINIGSTENESSIFNLYFLNKDISLTNIVKKMKFSRVVLHALAEGSLSQIFDLGLSFYFMLCRKKYFENKPKLTCFLT